jgi:aldose sugar dehydrogenase
MHRLIVLVLFLLLSLPARAQDAPGPLLEDPATGTTYRVEQFAPANFPVGLTFAPDGRLFYNEKTTGNVRVVTADGTTQRDPVLSVTVDSLVERGMLGLSADPNFEENDYIWLVYTAVGTAADWPANKLVRFREVDGIAQEVEEFYSLPITTGELHHNGGNVHFDADGRLYLSIGDYGDPTNAQDIDTPQGAIHRFDVTDDGLTPAADNPFDDNSLYAYGFRNPFDFDFDPVSGQVWATENGPSCDDEVNLVLAGFNYGWNEAYACYGTGIVPKMENFMPPLISFDPTIGISGVIFYDGDAFPEWENDLFFCDWVNGDLHRAVVDETRSRVLDYYPLDLDGVTCKIDITVGPDGALYFGTVGDGDGYIYRIVPA